MDTRALPLKMRAHCRLEIGCRDAATAERLLSSLAVDNEGFARSWREGSTLVTEAKADSPGALRHTLEDLLACLAAAEGADASTEGE